MLSSVAIRDPGKLTASYRDRRRNRMELLTHDMRRLVEAELGFVATVCPDGTPNLSPKGTIAVWDDSHLVFADIHSPGTTGNLRSNPNIEVDVVDQLARRGYRFKGTASVHADGVEFERGVELYERRGPRDARGRIQAIVVIAVERPPPVRSPAYALGAPEAALAARYFRQLPEQPPRSEHPP